MDLHKSQCQALPSFYTGRTCFFFQALSKWAECISSTTFRGGAGTEQVWLWEKQVNDFTASVEILSARGGWRSLIHAAARSRATPRARWGQLRFCPIVCEHPPGAGVSQAL